MLKQCGKCGSVLDYLVCRFETKMKEEGVGHKYDVIRSVCNDRIVLRYFTEREMVVRTLTPVALFLRGITSCEHADDFIEKELMS